MLNFPIIAKMVEDFYVSPDSYKDLRINIGHPINDVLELKVTKLSTYNETLANILARIKLHIRSIHKAELHDTNNNTKKTFICNSINERNNIIKTHRQETFRKYLSKHEGLSGHLKH